MRVREFQIKAVETEREERKGGLSGRREKFLEKIQKGKGWKRVGPLFALPELPNQGFESSVSVRKSERESYKF